MNICLCCGSSTKNRKFCSRSCAARVNNNVKPKRVKAIKPVHSCAGCGAPTLNDSFCSNRCQQAHVANSIILQWQAGDASVATGSMTGNLSLTIKRWLLDQACGKCPKCGWDEVHPVTGKCPLEVDHINGDRTDNRYENLRVLCPNCHALTTTFRALNSQRGRNKYHLLISD